MKVRELASTASVTVGPSHTLREAARVMSTSKVGSAVVQDAEQLVGILTERDVLHAVADGVDLDSRTIDGLMTRDVVTASPDWDVVEAAATMATRRIRHLVVYEGGQLLGVLSVRDVLPALLPAKYFGAD